MPTDVDRPGRYADGPAPGQLGPAVLAGHGDSRNGTGIFRLGAVRPGARVRVARADGSVATFAVDKVERYTQPLACRTACRGSLAGVGFRDTAQALSSSGRIA